MSDAPRFPSACRQFLSQLDELVDGRLDSGTGAHEQQCSSCAARLQAARRQVALLRELEAPEVPAEVHAPEFLQGIYERATSGYESEYGESLRSTLSPADPLNQVRKAGALSGIYERVNADYETELGDTLRETFGPVDAPEGVSWTPDHELSSGLEPSLRSALEGAQTPGWMWRRIRAQIEAEQVQRQSRRSVPVRLALAAAAVLVSGLLLFENPFTSGGAAPTEYPLIPVVFQMSNEPFESGLSLDQLAEVGR